MTARPYALALAFLVGVIGLAVPSFVDPLVRHVATRVMAWAGGL